MARVKIQEPQTQPLEELIPLYGEQNTQCNALKKVVADLNTKVKAAIHAAKQENKDITVGGWKCTLTVTDDTKVNEDRLLDVLKRHKIAVIKTKEYIDFDELERLIYAGSVPQEAMLEMDACNEKGTKETLRCTKLKEA